MTWVKGQSGNPGGRAPEVIELKEVRRLAQADSKEAYGTILAMMRDADKDSVRLAAALAILRIAGMKWSAQDSEVLMHLDLAKNPYRQMETGKLLTLASVSSTMPSGEGGS